MTVPDLSIVVVTWNVRSFAVRCIEHLFASNGVTVEVIVVDNASTDRTPDVISERWPQVQLVVNGSNRGFAVATNQGIRVARGRNILLLNPDTEVQPTALARLVNLADQCEDVGVVGPRLISPDGSVQFVGGRRFPRLFEWFAHYIFLDRLWPQSRLIGGLLMTWWDHLDTRQVEAVCGACMLIPRRVIDRIGLLDESHPMYLEDIDYCARVHGAGLVNLYVADAIVVHFGSKSSDQIRTDAAIVSLEATLIFFERYSGGASRIVFRPLVALRQAFRLPVFIARWTFSLVAPSLGQGVDASSLSRELTILAWALGLVDSRQIRTQFR